MHVGLLLANVFAFVGRLVKYKPASKNPSGVRYLNRIESNRIIFALLYIMLHLIDKIVTQAHGREAVSLGSHDINLSASHNTLELLHSGTQFNIFLLQGLP